MLTEGAIHEGAFHSSKKRTRFLLKQKHASKSIRTTVVDTQHCGGIFYVQW